MICGVNFGPRYSGITSWLINCLNAVSESFAPNDFRRMSVEPILRNELIVNAPPHPWSDCSRHAQFRILRSFKIFLTRILHWQ